MTCNMLEAFEAATLHSAHMLGINHQKGTFNADTDVNFVFSDDLNSDTYVKRAFRVVEEVQL